MTGLLSPVALFLPGTTHDYAIWQAGPSILSRTGSRGRATRERRRGRAGTRRAAARSRRHTRATSDGAARTCWGPNARRARQRLAPRAAWGPRRGSIRRAPSSIGRFAEKLEPFDLVVRFQPRGHD